MPASGARFGGSGRFQEFPVLDQLQVAGASDGGFRKTPKGSKLIAGVDSAGDYFDKLCAFERNSALSENWGKSVAF